MFIDEAPILFEYPTISEMVARLCANGAKAGIKVIISAQDPDTIARSPSASKILQNRSGVGTGYARKPARSPSKAHSAKMAKILYFEIVSEYRLQYHIVVFCVYYLATLR